jgi:hypothetical protein
MNGSPAWQATSGGGGRLGAYVDRASVAPGETLSLYLGSYDPVDLEWYRLGWYGGDGGRLLRVDQVARAAGYPAPVIDPVTGLAEIPFAPVLQITVPPDWLSGLYVVVIRARGGGAAAAPFVVRPPASDRSPVLFVSAATTWQAYNPWGGADFYAAGAADDPTAAGRRRAVEVSFDRPYLFDDGTGYQRRWELQFVRWQEREGRDVAYVADVDLELHPDVLQGRKLIVFAGHHEYWSRPMRIALEAAVAAGVNVSFLSANEIYWQVRLGPSPLGPARRVICYKSTRQDPLTATIPSLTTCRWRERPVNDPEARIVGQMYGHIVRRPANWIVVAPRHWLYEGTRLAKGDALANLVGQEYDTIDRRYAPPGTAVLARGPVDSILRPGQPTYSPSIHTATVYTAPSGATVLAAGTFQWSWAIDSYGSRTYAGVQTPFDPRVVRMTRNIFDRLGDGPA